MLSGITVVEDPEVEFCTTKQVSNVSGECTANIRKGKTIFFYEMEVKVPWEGTCTPPCIVYKNNRQA